MTSPEPLAVLAGATAGGYAIVRFFSEGLLRRERLAWSMACGLVLLAVVSSGFMQAGLAPGPEKFEVTFAVLAAVSLIARRPRRTPSPLRWPGGGASILPAVLSALALLAVALFAAQAARGGMWATDYLAIWGLKAKTFFMTASITARIFRDPALAYSHPEYPLLVPLSLSSLAAATRAWDEHSLALLYPFCALATVLLVSGFLVRRLSSLAGAAGGLLVALCTPLYAQGNLGTAEIPMALGLALAATAFLDARERETTAACVRLFFAAVFCAATKAEGSLFVLLLLAAILAPVLRRRPVPWQTALALLLPLLGHAVAMRLLRGSLASRDVAWSLLLPGRFGDLPARVREVLLQVTGVEAQRHALALLAFATFLIVTRPGLADPLLVVLVLQILAYGAACVLSSFDPVWQVESAFSRITWTLFPVWALIACARVFPDRAEVRAPSGELARRSAIPRDFG